MGVDPVVAVAIIGLFAAPITGIVTWWLNRSKERIDRTASLIAASGEAVDAIRDVMVALQNDLDKARAELDRMQKQYEELKDMNESLLQINKELLASIQALRNDIHGALEQYKDAPGDFWAVINNMIGEGDDTR